MFSFGAKKANPPRPKTQPQPNGFLDSLNFQFDNFAVDAENQNDDSDDEDLEAELAALTGTSNAKAPKRTKKTPTRQPKQTTTKTSHDYTTEFNSDSDCSSIDDAEVEDELHELCQTTNEEASNSKPSTTETPQPVMTASSAIFNERLKMYIDAKTVAEQKGDVSKVRRFDRAIKTIKDLMKQAASGKNISPDDLPPTLAVSLTTPEQDPAKTGGNENLVSQQPSENKQPTSGLKPSVGLPPPIPPRSGTVAVVPAPTVQPRTMEPAPRDPEYEKAVQLRLDYRMKALAAKNEGDQTATRHYVALVRLCDQLMKDAQEGKSVDWSLLSLYADQPTAPTENQPIKPSQQSSEEPLKAASDILPPPENKQQAESAQSSAPAPESGQPPEEIPIPRTTLEALEQRLAKFQSIQEESKGNASKHRRIGRIVKQYQDALKAHKAGRLVPFDELPDLPGYPPIPGAPVKVENPDAAPQPAPVAPITNPVAVPAAAAINPPTQAKTSAAVPSIGAIPKTRAPQTQQAKQLALLLERQDMFKQAAIQAKKQGDRNKALEYIRLAKGFDSLIESNKNGIRVDIETTPIPPQLKRDFLTATGDDLTEEGFVELPMDPSVGLLVDTGAEERKQLELLLKEQAKKCAMFVNHHKEIGDVANANRFDHMLATTVNDIQKVKRSSITPPWHFEMKNFPVAKCCVDLKDDELEIQVVRGSAYNVPNPKTVDTYVKLEVPLPNTDNPTKHRTNLVKDTNSPEYKEKFVINFPRQSRSMQRIFKSKAIKLEVFSKGGFLRSDILLGTATLKLADLLIHCEVRAVLDLMEGRKMVGGKLEVSARLRDPLTVKETENFQEKWIVLD